MNRLYLHVGTHKTGTTALQYFFAGNRARLSRLGVHYPAGRLPHHARLADALEAGDRQQIIDALSTPEAARHPAVLLSSESFVRLAAKLAFVRELAPRVTVVIYLRRQDSYIQSNYKSSVKNHTQSALTFAEYYASLDPPDGQPLHRRFDWYGLVQSWAAVFGRENVVVRPYERGQFAGGSIFADFLGVLGLALDEGFALPTAEQSNTAFSPEVVELLRLSNRLRDPAEHQLLVKFLGECFTGSAAAPRRSHHYLSPAARVALLERFEESNRRVAQEYLGREDGRLFREPWPDPAAPWQEDVLDAQRLVPPLMVLITRLRQQSVRLSQRLEQVEMRFGIASLRRRDLPTPLALWRRWRDGRVVAASGLVDARHYLEAYPDVAACGADPVRHYVSHGWIEGRNPSASFDTIRYLAAHPDVAASGRCPLVFLARARPR